MFTWLSIIKVFSYYFSYFFLPDKKFAFTQSVFDAIWFYLDDIDRVISNNQVDLHSNRHFEINYIPLKNALDHLFLWFLCLFVCECVIVRWHELSENETIK